MRSKMLVVLVSLVMGLPVWCAAANDSQSKPLSPFEQSVMSAQKALLEAVEKGDVGYVQGVVMDDCVRIGTNGDADGKGEIVGEARHPAERSKQNQPILYEFRVIPLNDGAAVVIYNAVLPGSNPRYQHISNTWIKQGEQWKLKFQQSTPNLWSATDL